MFTASINNYNKGLTKKDFIEYLKRQDLITEEEIQEIDAMSLDSISSIYSEEFCQFSELNNQKMAESKEQTASIFPEQDMQSGGVNDITVDDATSAIKAEFLAEEENTPSLDEIEGEIDTDEMIDDVDLDLDDVDDFDDDTDIKEDENADTENRVRENRYSNSKNKTINIPINEIDNYNNTLTLLRDMYKDEDVMSIIDEDGDGKISDKEKKKFESYIKGDKDKLELDDIKQTLKDIKNEKFDIDDYKKYKVPDDKLETDKQENTNEANTLSQNQGANGASGGGGSYGGGSSNSAGTASNSDPDDIKQMNLDQLRTAKKAEEDKVQKEKVELDKAYNGDTEELQKAQKECDETQDAYKEAMKGESEEAQKLEEQRENALKEIDSANAEVDEQTKKIDETQELINQNNVEIMACEANIEALKAALASYDGAEAKDSAEQQEIEAAKAEIEAQIAQLEEQKAKLEEQKAKLEEQQAENQQALTEKQAVLNEKETAYQDISNQIKECVSKETKEALEAFDNAKDKLKTTRDEQIKTAREAVKKSQDKIVDIDKLIAQKEAEQLRRDKSNFDPVRDALDPSVKMQSVHLAGPPEMQIMIPEGMDLNGKELTAAVFLHGDGQNPENMGDGSYTRLDSVSTPAGTPWNGYNGIVIIPRAGYNWENGISEDTLKQCISTVQNATGCTIQTGNMVLMGASRGGAGVLNTASQPWAKNYFGSAVAISAFSGSTNNTIPLITVWGTSDNPRAIGYTSNVGAQIQMPVSGDHNTVVQALFKYDSNGNGVPDVMERAYGLMH